MGAELRGNPVVGDLLQMNITEKAEKLEKISALAEKEMILEESVRHMKAQWNQATFEVRSVGISLLLIIVNFRKDHLSRPNCLLKWHHT